MSSINLFVYGTLRSEKVFRHICNYSFTFQKTPSAARVLFADKAVVCDFTRISPDNLYWYACKKSGSILEGVLIYDLPFEALEKLDKYEGDCYMKKNITVSVNSKTSDAVMYVCNPLNMQKQFGLDWHCKTGQASARY